MRLSKQKTPLARLRVMLTKTIEVPARGKKRAGQMIKKRVPLSQKDIAEWLGLSVFAVQSIETGRGKLTIQNAEIIMHQTGVDFRWLLNKKSSPYPITLSGRRHTQNDFERAQANLKTTGLTSLKAQRALPEFTASIATILLHACKRGERNKGGESEEIDFYIAKLRNAIREIMSTFPQKPDADLSQWIDMRETSHRAHDLQPMLNEWDEQLLKIAVEKRQRWQQAARK